MNKRGEIELSVGTIVIIVLAMSMLILGLVLIRQIFSGATDSVRQIDTGVKAEINKLFSQNQDKKLILYPDSKIIKLEKNSQDSGFAVAIRNIDITGHMFTVKTVAEGNAPACGSGGHPMLGTSPTVSIIVGDVITTGRMEPSNIMINSIPVRFSVSDSAPACTFRVKVLVDKDLGAGQAPDGDYDFDYMDIQILSK